MNVAVVSIVRAGDVKLIVFTSAFVDESVHVETPEILEAEQALSVLFVPVTLKVGVTPETAILLVSFKVIVMVLVLLPLATVGPVATMLELASTGGPPAK